MAGWLEPTAVHAVTLAQETPRRSESGAVAWMAHAVPFHRSATTPTAFGPAYEPTAVHAAGDVHDTDSSNVICAPRTRGTRWRAHLVPFHSSATARPSLYPPTARHVVTAGQSTPSSPACRCGGVTGSRTVHRCPFHSSARVARGFGFPELPTARHMSGAAHDTAVSAVPLPGLGVCWIAHRRPFQRSASVPSSVDPTAVQADAEVQDTPVRPATDPAAAGRPGAAGGPAPGPSAAAANGRVMPAHAVTASTTATLTRLTACLTRLTIVLGG